MPIPTAGVVRSTLESVCPPGKTALIGLFAGLAGAFVYLYLFLSVDGSFDIKFEWVSDHKTATVLILLGGIGLIVLIVWLLRARLAKFWAKAKQGGQVLGRQRVPWS